MVLLIEEAMKVLCLKGKRIKIYLVMKSKDKFEVREYLLVKSLYETVLNRLKSKFRVSFDEDRKSITSKILKCIK